MFSTYVIENPRGVIYIGHSDNVDKRIKRHNGELLNRKKSFTQKQGGPWELIYEEKFDTREKARKREKELKSSRGRAFLAKFRKVKKDT